RKTYTRTNWGGIDAAMLKIREIIPLTIHYLERLIFMKLPNLSMIPLQHFGKTSDIIVLCVIINM
ncbi:MAG: hypothetical protein ACKPEQ_20960, partial [Dolichospermum sp.]